MRMGVLLNTWVPSQTARLEALLGARQHQTDLRQECRRGILSLSPSKAFQDGWSLCHWFNWQAKGVSRWISERAQHCAFRLQALYVPSIGSVCSQGPPLRTILNASITAAFSPISSLKIQPVIQKLEKSENGKEIKWLLNGISWKEIGNLIEIVKLIWNLLYFSYKYTALA